jgi:hypothetical protein
VKPNAVDEPAEASAPHFWLLGALLPGTLAWMGLGTALVVAVALAVELFGRRQVSRRLQALDTYLPTPTAWQRSAQLVSYRAHGYRAA